MLKTFRNWLWAIGDSVVADQRREIYSLRSQLASTTKAADEATAEIRRLTEVRQSLLRLLDAVLSGIGFEIGQVSDEWKDSPSAARNAVGAHVDELRRHDITRADAAEGTADSLRSEIRDLQRQLETEQRAHERTKHEKTCTEAENRLLAAIHETDVKRREAERAVEVRREAEAESIAGALRAEDRE